MFTLPMTYTTPDPGGSGGATKGLSTSPEVAVPRCPSWAGLGAGLSSLHLAGHLCSPTRIGLRATCPAPTCSFQGLVSKELIVSGCFSPTGSGEGEVQAADGEAPLRWLLIWSKNPSLSQYGALLTLQAVGPGCCLCCPPPGGRTHPLSDVDLAAGLAEAVWRAFVFVGNAKC